MSFIKRLFIVVSLLIPVQPVFAAALTVSESAVIAPAKEQSSSLYRRMIGSLARYKRVAGNAAHSVRDAIGATPFLETSMEALTQAAYDEGPVEFLIESDFIGRTESKELMLEEVSQFLGGNTITSLGTRALASMLTTFERNNMHQVQTAVRRLTQDDALYNKVETALTQFAHNERSFLMYWDPNKTVKGSQPHLFAKAQELNFEELYRFEKTFAMGPQPLDEIPNPAYLATMIGNQFPKPETSQAKMAGARARIFGKLFYWAYSIFGVSVARKMVQGFAEGQWPKPIETSRTQLMATLAATFLFWKITQAVEELREAHEAYEEKGLSEREKKNRELLLNAAHIKVLEEGSWWDAVIKTKEKLHPGETETDEKMRWVKDKTSWIIPRFIKAAPGVAARNLPNFVMKPVRGVGTVIDDLPWIFASVLFIGQRAKQGFTAFGNSLAGFATMDYVWDCMQEHATGLAASLRSIQSLHDVIREDSQLQKTNVHEMLEQATSSISETVREAMQAAHDPAFVQKQSRGGQSLRLHDLMLQASDDLQSAVHGIAHLDALFALAKSVRSKNGCFVDWLSEQDTQAQMQIEDGIFVALPHAMPNSVSLGVDCANKAIVTGPNGAGKSIFIKMVGSNVVLAHAFGIAFASKARMHWLSMIRTSIDTGESVADELSRMQAQKMRMDSVMNELVSVVQKDQTAKGMFLTDEPLSGTTHKIAARKLENYCDRIGSISQMCGVMATHNEEPTKFADKGFVNYQVCIEELSNGMFKPLFKVMPGIPDWWFATDPETARKQDLFVDYTVAIKHKTNIEKELSSLTEKEQKVSEILQSGVITDHKKKRHLKDMRNHIELRIEYLQEELERATHAISRLESGQ
jgi:hypothetical protein